MIETIATGIHFVYTVIHYGFYFSYKTGQFLVTSIDLLLQNLIKIFNSLFELLIVILESFTIFFQDVVQVLLHILRICFNIVEGIERGISTALCVIKQTNETLVSSVGAVSDFIDNIIFSVVTGIWQVFIFLKRVLVLFGSGVWFSITFVPLLIVYIGTLITYYIGRMLEEIIDSISASVHAVKIILKNIYEFLTDVPVEAAIGILIAISMVYIFTQFYIVLFEYIYQYLQNTLRNLRHRYHRMRRRHVHIFITQRPALRSQILPRSRPQIRPRSELNSVNNQKTEMSNERYCVICQEHVKCILVLPCRHVCMCNECSIRLQLYNNTCPICRNEIESTMKIFV